MPRIGAILQVASVPLPFSRQMSLYVWTEPLPVRATRRDGLRDGRCVEGFGMVMVVLFGGLFLGLAAAGGGAMLGLTVWGCLALGVLGGSLGAGALVAAAMLQAVRQELAEQHWQDRRTAPVPDRRKQPWQRRPWQERRKAPWQDRRGLSPSEVLAGR